MGALAVALAGGLAGGLYRNDDAEAESGPLCWRRCGCMPRPNCGPNALCVCVENGWLKCKNGDSKFEFRFDILWSAVT